MTPSESLGSDTSVDVNDSTLETTESIDSTESSANTELLTESLPETEGEVDPAKLANQPLILDGKKLSPQAQEALDELKAKDPALAAKIRHSLFQMDKFNREVPGGLKEVQQLRATIEQLGGDDGIKEVHAELDGWRGFDEQYMAGDPKVLDFMLSEPGGDQAFLKIAPAALDKFAELDGPGYTHYICKTVAENMSQAEIPLAMARLGDAIPADHPVRKIFDQVDGYLKGITNLGRKPPERKAEADPKAQSDFDKRTKDLDDRETKMRRDSWQGKLTQSRDSVFATEFKQLIGNRQLSQEQNAAFVRLFGQEMQSLTAAHGQKLDAYFNAKDENGYDKYGKQLAAKYVPTAIRNTLKILFPGAKPGPKPVTTATATPGRPVVPPMKGWEPTSSKYGDIKNQINWDATRRAEGSASEGRVVLFNGKRVQYKVS